MADTNDVWTYDRKRRCDQSGRRWHFVMRVVLDPDVPYDDRPYELSFRDDDRTQFGALRFARWKDNPYRGYGAVVTKIMNDAEFRRGLLDPETATVWRKSWK